MIGGKRILGLRKFDFLKALQNRLFFCVMAVLVIAADPMELAAMSDSQLIHVTGNLLRPTYHHEYSTEQIEGMSGLQAPSRAAQEPGLTLFEYEISSQYEMTESGPNPNGPLRVWAKSIDVNFSITRMEVYISNKYPRGSCQYQTILGHENTMWPSTKGFSKSIRRF